MPNDEQRQLVAQPLQINIDLQLGTDSHPWIRIQFATPGLSTAMVFPMEHAETVINTFTEGIRQQVKKATKRQVDSVMPDFTGIDFNGAN